MASVEITSAKIKGKLFCDYEFSERYDGGSQTVTVKNEAPIHDDMRIAFRQLVPHLAFICEEVDDDPDMEIAMDNMENLSESLVLYGRLQSYKVTAFKLTGTGESQGVVITGQKKLKTGKVVNLNTPLVKWEDDYQYINELRVAIEKCRTEVLLYSDGKHAPETQASLFNDEEMESSQEPDFESE